MAALIDTIKLQFEQSNRLACKSALHNSVTIFVRERWKSVRIFVRYTLAVCTVEAEPDKSINELISMQAHLRTLLVGRAGEDGVNEVNRGYAGASNTDRLQINNPLRNWTNEDVWSFASSLSLPYATTTTTTAWRKSGVRKKLHCKSVTAP